MRGNMTMFDLVHLELSYAPPFSSAKDPVNIAGLAAENILTNKVDIFHYHDIASLNPEEVTLLDVRTVKEYGKSHIPDFINIPLDSLRDNLDKLDKSKPVYVTCLAGLRSYIACRILMQNGFTCKSLCGGYEIYCNVNIV
jgi:rhodanese-related sulfurtransferase